MQMYIASFPGFCAGVESLGTRLEHIAEYIKVTTTMIDTILLICNRLPERSGCHWRDQYHNHQPGPDH